MPSYNRRIKGVHFFSSSTKTLYANFDRLFSTPDETDQDELQTESGGAEQNKAGTRDLGYDILPYAICYAKVANCTLDHTMNTSAAQVFYIVSYELERIENENKRLKKKGL